MLIWTRRSTDIFQTYIISLFVKINLDVILMKWSSIIAKVRLRRLREKGVCLNFVPQGGYYFEIAGDASQFSIDITSHIKSDTFIECSGGVSIGRYFHPGRGLTIYSATHNYDSGTRIPYDEIHIKKPVVIEDFVWCGANVTIMPGVTIGEGAVIGAGSVVVKNVQKGAVVGGNPARIVKWRDMVNFEKLKAAELFE